MILTERHLVNSSTWPFLLELSPDRLATVRQAYKWLRTSLVVFSVSLVGFGQSWDPTIFDAPRPTTGLVTPDINDPLSILRVTGHRPAMPTLRPEQALQAFLNHDRWQAVTLQGCTDDTLVVAVLPDTAHRGTFELQRTFAAPRSLKYTPINFTGDTFVKSEVVSRMLQAEVDHVQKNDRLQTALTEANYRFSYKGEQKSNEHAIYTYQVKPRHKKAGLFKGHIYLDARNGNLTRSEGAIVKSSSFFVRKIEFVQDYVEIRHFIFPTHLQTSAHVSVLGRVNVDVYHRDYRPHPLSASIY
jgi:hypothetical protein